MIRLLRQNLAFTAAVVILVVAGKASAQTPVTQALPQESGQRADDGRSNDYCSRNLGTWFYCETEPVEADADVADSQEPGGAAADLAAAETFKKEMEDARIVAVWNPTDENVRRYYAYQQVTMQKSGLFADMARRMIWSDPSLDYTLQRPISASAKSEWSEARTTDRDLFFRGIFDQIGIFYVYRGSCGPCRVASPIVRQFGQRYGFVIKPISADGAGNPEFPDAAADRGQLKAWGITDPVTPAYLIFQKPSLDARGLDRGVVITVSDGKQIHLRSCQNPKGCLTYLGAGVLSVDEMADRLFVTLATRPGEDF